MLPAGVRVTGAVRVRVPLLRSVTTAHGAWTVVDSWLLRLDGGGGRAGLGEATLGPDAAPTDQARLDGLVRSMVGPGAAAGPGAEVDPGARAGAAGSAVTSALGGALLDLGCLPGAPPRAASVTLNATIGAEDADACVAAARAAVAAGFRTLKLKGGTERSSAELAERIGAVRDAVGPDVALRLDVNGAWDEATAQGRLAAIADLGVAYVEQPVPPGDVPGMARLRAAVPGVPIAADEAVSSREAARALLAAGAADVLVVKPARVGGPAEALAIAADAAAAGVSVTISTLLETGVGMAAAFVTAAMLPGPMAAEAHGLATGSLLASDLLADGPRAAGPVTEIPAGPGLGIRLDHDAVTRFTVDRIGAWP